MTTDPQPTPTDQTTEVLTAPRFLRWLKVRRRLRPLLAEALAETLVFDAARAASLAVTPEELQHAADEFRRRQGLTSAERTRAWLDQEGLRFADFEELLERDLLLDKFKDRLVADRLADHFAAHRDSYARARLRQLVVGREDLARELLIQLREEGADFADLARADAVPAAEAESGDLGWVLRRQLSPAVAEAVFAARVGDVVGPLGSPHGFHLVLVDALQAPELDAPTAAVIRQELFDAWLADRLRESLRTCPLPDSLA